MRLMCLWHRQAAKAETAGWHTQCKKMKAQTKISVPASLTLYALIDCSFWFDTINLGWLIVYIEGSQAVISL